MKRLIAFALLLNAALMGGIAWQLVIENQYKDEIFKHMSIVELPINDGGWKAKTIRFSGVNVQVVNGTGKTGKIQDGLANGLGNLIVGYQELREADKYSATDDSNDRSGSHNLVVGSGNNYSIWGGQVVGYRNTISGKLSTVSGGEYNTASGISSTVSGGCWNMVSAGRSVISGGCGNFITDAASDSTVSGGYKNQASSVSSTISGGQNNTASGDASTIGGGNWNTASGKLSTVGGGGVIREISLTGGLPVRWFKVRDDSRPLVGNRASATYSTVSGGKENIASGEGAAVSGGRDNRARGDWSRVSGGYGLEANAENIRRP